MADYTSSNDSDGKKSSLRSSTPPTTTSGKHQHQHQQQQEEEDYNNMVMDDFHNNNNNNSSESGSGGGDDVYAQYRSRGGTAAATSAGGGGSGSDGGGELRSGEEQYQLQQQQQQQQQHLFPSQFGTHHLSYVGSLTGDLYQQHHHHQLPPSSSYSRYSAPQTAEKKRRRRFTKEEDELIMRAIPRFENARGIIDWGELQKDIKIDRTKEQIRTRYARILKSRGPHPHRHQRQQQSPLYYQQQSPHKQYASYSQQYQQQPHHHQGYGHPGSSGSESGSDSGGLYGGRHIQHQQQPRGGNMYSSGNSSNRNGGGKPYESKFVNRGPNGGHQRAREDSNSDGSHSGSGSGSGSSEYDEPDSKKQKTLHFFHHVSSGTLPAVEGSFQRTSFTQTDADFDATIRQLRMEIKEKTDQLESSKHMIADLQQQVSRFDLMLKSEIQKSEATQQKYRHALEQMVREKAEHARREELRVLKKKMLHVGSISYERKGLEVFEVWQDGEEFQTLEKQLQTLREEKESLERSKKTLQRRKQNYKKSGQDNLDELFGINEQEEMLRIRQGLIKKDEAALNEDKRRLLIEKSQVIREIKRNRDQERSRFNNFPVIQDRYLLKKMLGRGGFSEVYQAYDLKELRIVACKIHQLNINWKEHRKENYIKHVLRECQIHKSIRHDRVVQMYDTFIYDNNTFVTVLEYCEGSDLDMHIKTFQRIPEKEARNIICQVFSGLKYLNTGTDKKIIHFDLKPANIMYNVGQIKITDFGLSKIMEEEDAIELTSQGAGTYWYLPPECFELGQVPKISSKVDVWSAGVVFYQMLYGKKPFGNDLSQQKILTEQTIINARNVQFPPKPVVSEEAKEFIRKCLTHDQARRPDVLMASQDLYLRGDFPRQGNPPPSSHSLFSMGYSFGTGIGGGGAGSVGSSGSAGSNQPLFASTGGPSGAHHQNPAPVNPTSSNQHYKTYQGVPQGQE